MKLILYVVCKDTDNSCSDEDCCGGPFPSPAIKVFSSIEAAKACGIDPEDLSEVVVDSDEYTHINVGY